MRALGLAQGNEGVGVSQNMHRLGRAWHKRCWQRRLVSACSMRPRPCMLPREGKSHDHRRAIASPRAISSACGAASTAAPLPPPPLARRASSPPTACSVRSATVPSLRPLPCRSAGSAAGAAPDLRPPRPRRPVRRAASLAPLPEPRRERLATGLLSRSASSCRERLGGGLPSWLASRSRSPRRCLPYVWVWQQQGRAWDVAASRSHRVLQPCQTPLQG